MFKAGSSYQETLFLTCKQWEKKHNMQKSIPKNESNLPSVNSKSFQYQLGYFLHILLFIFDGVEGAPGCSTHPGTVHSMVQFLDWQCSVAQTLKCWGRPGPQRCAPGQVTGIILRKCWAQGKHEVLEVRLGALHMQGRHASPFVSSPWFH